MKKVFLLAAGLAMILTACQKEESLSDPGGVCTQAITVTIPQELQTRAMAADFGNGSQVDRCLLQIYRNGQPYGEQQTATVTNNAATFTLRLVAQQTYDFVFWADCSADGGRYDTDDLTAITLKDGVSYTGNDDKFDAFFFCKKDYTVSESFSEEFTLRRPFGQLNVKTNDMGDIPGNTTDLKPTKIKVKFTSFPTAFNAYTGQESGNAAVEYEAGVLNANGELTVDYVWAPVEQATLADFSMTFYNADGSEISTNSDFKNIPIRRNYRTNVSGNLLTKQGAIDVTIDPEFYTPDYNVDGDAVAIELTAAGTLNEHLDELAEATGIRIAGPMNTSDLDAIQKLLKTTDGKDAPLKTLDLSQATGLTGNIAVSPDGSSSTYKNNTLKTIVLPEGVTSIKTWAFAGFYALTEINIPSTVTTIGMSAFRNCRSLESITLPEGITEIPTNCFWYATQLKTVNIPSTVREIADGAFSFTALEGDLVFGENLEVIGGSAFYRCKLTSVDLSKTKITKLNGMMNTFADCSELTRLVLPPAITEIGTTAFSGCPVETIDLPATVTKIANNSFYWGAAKTVICRATVPPTLSAKIYPSQTETVLKVPAEAIGDYKTATNWNTGRFKAIEAIE
mgnify:CR=1 FL=1